jgi:hypothetical protein
MSSWMVLVGADFLNKLNDGMDRSDFGVAAGDDGEYNVVGCCCLLVPRDTNDEDGGLPLGEEAGVTYNVAEVEEWDADGPERMESLEDFFESFGGGL